MAVATAPRQRSRWTLADLIGVETLQAIQDAFAHAFGLPTVIVDHEGRNVTEITHRVTFCEDLTRPSPGGARCQACDLDAMRRAESSGRPAVFHCWNGLDDCAVPIVSSGGEVFGHFLCGQVFTEPQALDRYRETARELGIDEDAYLRSARQIRVVARETLERSVEAMGVLAAMIADQAAAAVQNLAMLEEALAAKATTERLTAELDTVVEACAAIGSAGDSLATLERIADSLGRVIPSDSCIIFGLEPDGRLRPLTVRDPYAEAIAAWRPARGSGIWGYVASTGVALRIDDVAADRRFEPVPGVPVEPEAMLCVPMLLDGEVTGVITVSRFQRRTFTDHELDVLKILASQSAVALGTATARAEAARRLEVERGQSLIFGRIAAGGSLEQLLADVLETVAALLACDAAVIRLDEPDLAQPPALNIGRRAVERATRAFASELERARVGRAPAQVEDGRRFLLLAPIAIPGGWAGELLLWRDRPFGAAEERLAGTLAQQTGIGIENARIERSQRRLLTGYKLLAGLGGELLAAREPEAVVRVLAERAHELVAGRAALVALAGAGTALEIWRRERSSLRQLELPTAGRPRLRLPEAEEARDAREDVLDAWGAAVVGSVPGLDGAGHVIAAPLGVGGRMLGGLIVVGTRPFGPDDHKLLSVLAQAAAGALAAVSTYRETDEILRERVRELAVLTELAQTVTAAHDAGAVAGAVLSAFRILAGVAGAALALPTAGGSFRIAKALDLPAGEQRRLRELVDATALEERVPLERGGALLVPLLLADCCLGLILAPAPAEPRNHAVLMSLARYGAIALENARLLTLERKAVAELRRIHRETAAQAGELERSLAIHRALSQATLAREGLASVARRLVSLQGGRVAIFDDALEPLAGFPDAPSDEEPLQGLLRGYEGGGEAEAIEVPLGEGHVVLAAAIRAEGERLGWIVQRLGRTPAEVDRVAVVQAAMAAAVAILRERAVGEVEARLRGEFLEALFAPDARSDELARRARALGYDLEAVSRVAVAALATESEDGAERLYRAATGFAAREAGPFLVARRGEEITVVGPAASNWPEALCAALARVAGPTLLGVGTEASAAPGHRESFLAARQALRALRALGRTGVLALDGDGLEQLLLKAADSERLLGFVERYVGPLADYDRRRGSELVRTLELSFEHGWNLQAAARAAHLHGSTLRYRLSRVEALTGVDLRRPDDRLAMQLALRTARLLRS